MTSPCVRRVGSRRPGAATARNPDLKPILSTNLDAGLEWYFAKRSLLSFGLFYMDLRSYAALGYGSKT